MTFILEIAFCCWLAWAAACWLAPFAIARKRHPLEWGASLPWPLLKLVLDAKIHVYIVEDLQGYACSGVLGFRRVILLNGPFMRFARTEAKQFIVAHELAHHLLGHVYARMVCRMFLLDWIPGVRRELSLTENAANRYATQLTGLSPSVAFGPIAMSEASGSGLATEEEEGKCESNQP